MTDKEKFEAIKAVERIPLPPKAGDNSNSSSDLYVSQGLDDIDGKPEITDPSVRDEFGLDEDNSETPPTDPSKMARAGDIPNLQPADATGGRFTNSDDQGIPQVPEVSQDEYMKHLEASTSGDEIQGGTGDDQITSDSDGSFKDIIDANQDMERTPETGNTDNPMPHAGPNQEPLVAGNDDTMKITGGSDAIPANTKDQIIGGVDNDEQPIIPSEGDPQDYDEEEIKKKIDRQNLEEAVIPTMMEKPKPQVPPKPQVMHRDIKLGEDPLTSGTSQDQDPDELYKSQSRLDDSPLQDPTANKGNIGGINPNLDAQMTDQTDVSNLANDGIPEEASKFEEPVDPEGNNNLGDSGQARLQEEERTGIQQDQPLPNDSNDILDNTGLNVKPEIGYPQVSEDDYNKKVQDGSNPLEEKGEPLEDGMIVKPEDIQQHGGIVDPSLDGTDLGGTPMTPEGMTAHDQDPNTINDPTDSGIDEEEVDPNILHYDPETGRNYTDLTDEQGEEVPDLRWDQSPASDEEQPEVELEYEIVTKEEYDQHLDASKGQMQDPMAQDPMSEDSFYDELNTQSTDPEAPNPFGEDQQDDPLDPTETDKLGNPVELPTQEDNINEPQGEAPSEGGSSESPSKGGDGEAPATGGSISKPDEGKPKGDSQKSEAPSGGSDEGGGEEESSSSAPKESGGGEEESSEEPKEVGDKPKKKSSPKKSEDKEESDDSDKEESDDEESDDEAPKRKGSVKDIIQREHELLDSGVDEDEIHQLLEDEFGEERIEKAEETKTWKRYHG